LRSKVGRLLQSYSPNGGATWYSVLPTELSSSQSPPMLVQIPSTGDLLCVWNQVSGEEINRGFLRGRLSAAISKDNGLTWQNFKTLERQVGMDPADRIPAEFPIPRVTRARPGICELPEDFAMFSSTRTWTSLATRCLSGTPALGRRSGRATGPRSDPKNMPLRWSDYEQRGAEMTGEGVMRIYPLEWFYQ
jgi:hypothetical protein